MGDDKREGPDGPSHRVSRGTIILSKYTWFVPVLIAVLSSVATNIATSAGQGYKIQSLEKSVDALENLREHDRDRIINTETELKLTRENVLYFRKEVNESIIRLERNIENFRQDFLEFKKDQRNANRQ